jgi:hypothetical protein
VTKDLRRTSSSQNIIAYILILYNIILLSTINLLFLEVPHYLEEDTMKVNKKQIKVSKSLKPKISLLIDEDGPSLHIEVLGEIYKVKINALLMHTDYNMLRNDKTK